MCTHFSVLQDIKGKIQKMKLYQEQLMESLGSILDKHVPPPQDESGTSKKKKVEQPAVHKHYLGCSYSGSPHNLSFSCFQNNAHEIKEDLISLSEILEVGLHTVQDPQY